MVRPYVTSLLLSLSTGLFAQHTFQRLYIPPGSGAHCLGSQQLSDEGFLFTGIVSDGTDKVYMTRTDCNGVILWSKTYNNSSTIGNISPRAVELASGGYVLAASSGQYMSYNILVVKVAEDGTTVWQKVMQGTGDDVVNSVIEAQNGDIVVAGHTSSFGQDAGSPYTDVYIARLAADGTYLWGKAIGTDSNIDQAFDIIETQDSMLVATGRYIEQGTFYAFLLETDANGNVQFLRAYGDTNQYSCGYSVITTAGGFAFTGATTVTKNSFQDYPDVFLIKADLSGDTLWTRNYHSTNDDGSESGSSLVQMYDDGGYTIAMPTMGYPTVGNVPNKHVLLRTNATGTLTAVRSYNSGGSHYNFITKPKANEGVLMSGFTTNYEPGLNTMFKPIIVLTDDQLNSGCNETDLLAQTVTEAPPFQVREPVYAVASGGSLVNSSVSADIVWTDSVLCASSSDPCTNIGIATVENGLDGRVRFDPSTGTVVLEGFGGAVLQVDVFDVLGRRLVAGSTDRSLPVAATAAGVLIVVVQDGGARKTFRVGVVK